MHLTDLRPVFGLPHSEGEPLVIAGPCSAESEEQTLMTARLLASDGVSVFRAGVWKPRTKPGGFEGRGKEALEWLREVKEQSGMLTVTEVATRAHLSEALASGIDGVWIGARTATNPFAVQEIADALAILPAEQKDALTVLVKNPVNPDIELWIGAIERINSAGIRRLGAIHRGFSSYGRHILRNQPRWAIAIELGRRLPGLPVFFDPSHIAGRSDLVPGLIKKAFDMNYYGLFVETHCCPESALSDAAQQLTPENLKTVLSGIDRRSGGNPAELLEELRNRIDSLDRRLLELLAERMEISREIGLYKRERKIPVIQSERYRRLMEERVMEGERLGLSPEFIRTVLAAIHEESVRQQVD